MYLYIIYEGTAYLGDKRMEREPIRYRNQTSTMT